MADPIPAPMVQLPAETVEKLREVLRFQFSPPKRSQVDAVFTAASAVVDAAEQCEAKFARLQMERVNVGAEYEAAERRANRAENERDRLRALLDAAVPAASVPAADKLEALREAVANCRTAVVARFQMGQTADPMTEIELAAGAFVDAVAVAEQADKGEAADTPRVSHTNANMEGCVTCRNVQELGCMCGPNGCECPAPAAPVDEPCTCGESVPTVTTPGPCYWAENAPGVQSQVHCPRVPVNDEAEADMDDAEAAWLKWVYENADTFNTDRLSFKAGFRAARGEDA